VRAALPPLLAGIGAGAVVVATSSGPATQPAAILAVIGGLCIAGFVRSPTSVRFTLSRRAIATSVPAFLGCFAFALIALRTPIQRRVELASTNDRVVEWTAALKQWRSSPLTGVGPDTILRFQARDGTFAHFAHNEYLQVLAGAGVVGLVLLVFAVAAVAKTIRRYDALSSCACGALAAFALAALLDFDWHLSALGLFAGCAAGLASQPVRIADPPIRTPAQPARGPAGPGTDVQEIDTDVARWHLYVAMPPDPETASTGRLRE
jgi:O-antigen ligase